jgi:hypothetical protein
MWATLTMAARRRAAAAAAKQLAHMRAWLRRRTPCNSWPTAHCNRPCWAAGKCRARSTCASAVPQAQMDAWGMQQLAKAAVSSSNSSGVAGAMVPTQGVCSCRQGVGLEGTWCESAWVSVMWCCHLSGDGVPADKICMPPGAERHASLACRVCKLDAQQPVGHVRTAARCNMCRMTARCFIRG